jgi:signal transduction histidine kinase
MAIWAAWFYFDVMDEVGDELRDVYAQIPSRNGETFDEEDLREVILNDIVYLFLALLAVVLALNVWVYRNSIKPLYKLLKWLDDYKVGGKNSPLQNETDITEFIKLNRAAEESMIRAEKAFDKQKQFIGNASHELQTPLAVCLNRIEIMVDDNSLSEGQMNDLFKIYSTLEYLTRLNKSLLLLSKIDNRQFGDEEILNVNSIVKRFSENYEEIYSSMNVRVSIIEKGVFNAKMNESLASVLINNMIKNSYVHNIEGGRIEVVMQTGGITFKNTGQESPLEGDRIFERFYQGCRKEGSTGLGLTLATSVCELSGLRLEYYYGNDRMHCFKISPLK